MSEQNSNFQEESIDISSISNSQPVKPKKAVAKKPSNALGNVVKTIGFFIGFVLVAVTFVGAFFLYSKAPLFMAISLAVIIIGTLIATMVTILIYALGHVIIQNNEIIDKLNKM